MSTIYLVVFLHEKKRIISDITKEPDIKLPNSLVNGQDTLIMHVLDYARCRHVRKCRGLGSFRDQPPIVTVQSQKFVPRAHDTLPCIMVCN